MSNLVSSNPNTRCKFIKPNGQQCGAVRVKGTDYCSVHPTVKGLHKCNVVHTCPLVGNNFNMAFYSKRLGPKLRTILEQECAKPKEELYQVSEEIAIIRQIAADSLQLYNAVVESDEPQTKEQKESREELLALTGNMAKQSMEMVINACDKAARINATLRSVVDVNKLHEFSLQVTRIVKDCFDNDVDGMIEFDRRLTEELRLPSIGSKLLPTAITPDADVVAMDNSIPRSPE